MERKVAIENDLDHVKNYFTSRGCQVDSFATDQLESIGVVSHYNAIIISGNQQNTLGNHKVRTDAPVISAKGMTPEQVYDRVVSIES